MCACVCVCVCVCVCACVHAGCVRVSVSVCTAVCVHIGMCLRAGSSVFVRAYVIACLSVSSQQNLLNNTKNVYERCYVVLLDLLYATQCNW